MAVTGQAALADRVRAALQWWRAPLMAAFVAVGIYYIQRVSVWLWTGMAIAFCGEMIQMWAASHLRKDRSLATSGPYSYVRNPMYFGRFFVLLGFVIMIGSLWVVAAYMVLFAAYAQSRVGREEERLRAIFGEDYVRYCQEVRRWLPRLRPFAEAAGHRWQWSQVVANHEYLNLIAVLVVFAVILMRIR